MTAATLAPSVTLVEDAALVAALRVRDERAYLTLVHRYTPLMLRLAQPHVGSRALAEDVVQDTWVAVLRGIDRFEGRSQFKTWLLRILLNTARKPGLRESRTVCRGALPEDLAMWERRLDRQPESPEDAALGGETWALVEHALDTLPERQRAVVVLRDVEGWAADEVCAALDISDGNQRVLLHRARTHLREALTSHLSAS